MDYSPEIMKSDLLKRAKEYDVLVVRSRTKVDREVIDSAPGLKLIARPGTGLDNIDVSYAQARGISVVNSPESLVEGVAEHVVLLMLSLSRHLIEADDSTKSGKWEKNKLTGRELKGKVLGVVGLGRIGRRIAEICGAMGMEVLGYDVIEIPRQVTDSIHCRMVGLDEVFSSSDYITLHVPLTDESRHLVGESRISMMKRGAVIVNTSRGGVIDESSLASALREGRIGGAGLDVFESEPPTGDILTAPNVVLTPHIGGQTVEAQEDAISNVGNKINSFFSGAQT